MKGQLDRSNKHRAKVIEIYEDGRRAAVQFSSGRIECVNHRGDGGSPGVSQPPFYIGQAGMVDYVRTLYGYGWVFNPFKYELSKDVTK